MAHMAAVFPGFRPAAVPVVTGNIQAGVKKQTKRTARGRKRVALAYGLSAEALRGVLLSLPEKGRLELVHADGSRMAIARGVDLAGLRWLAQNVHAGSGSRLEVVLPKGEAN